MRTIVLLFLSVLLNSTSALSVISQLPIFTWLKNHERLGETPLEIGFPDGGNDVIRFYKVQRFYEDDCIMSGFLEKEPYVRATLTGGCESSEDFELTIVGSERLGLSTFKVTKGQVKRTGLNSNLGSLGVIDTRKQPTPSGNRRVPYFAWLGVSLFADTDFRNTFGSDEKVKLTMNKVVGHAQTWFSEKNLETQIILVPSISKCWKYDASIYPDSANLRAASDYVYNCRNSKKKPHQHSVSLNQVQVFLGIQGAFQRDAGRSYHATVCRKVLRVDIVSIVEHWEDLSVTGIYLAHEIAHTLGLGHDFNSSSYNQILYDSKGRSLLTYIGVLISVE